MFRFGDPGGRIYTAVGTNNANMIAYWTYVTTNLGSASIVAGGGRTTGSCIRMSNYAGSNWFYKLLDQQATWGVAYALKFNSLYTNTPPILTFYDNTFGVQVDLRFTPTGGLQFTRNGTNIGSASSNVLTSVNTWYHIEAKVTIHPSAGSIECRVNGTAVIGPTGSLNTRASTNSSANGIIFGNLQNIAGGSIQSNWDDIIIYDGQANDAQGNADINDFIGDCSLTWLLPTAAGATTNFTPDSGSNYARVNEATMADTTSYVESSTVNNIDSYVIADLAANVAQVKSIAVVNYAKKTDVGGRQANSLVRTNNINYPHTNAIALADSYYFNFQNWGKNPNTALNWSVYDINNLEIGQKVYA